MDDFYNYFIDHLSKNIELMVAKETEIYVEFNKSADSITVIIKRSDVSMVDSLFRYRIVLNNVSERVLRNRLDSKNAARIVVSGYRRYVDGLFFI